MLIFIICTQDDYGITFSDQSKTVLTAAPSSLSGDYVIPASVETILGRNSIKDSPFYLCLSRLTSIKFANFSKIKSICSFCFATSTIISADMSTCDNLPFLNNSLFSGCSRLETITLPSKIKQIKYGCFYNTDSLKSIVIPDSVEYLYYTSSDGTVFSRGLELVTISRNSNLTTIGDNVFSYTKLKYIFIPRYTRTISFSAINVKTLEKIEIDERNPYYSSDGITIFSGENNNTLNFVIPSIKYEYSIPLFVTQLGGSCMRSYQYNSLAIHDNVEIISAHSFSASNLINFSFPPNIQYIENGVFQYCARLETVTLTENIKGIHTGAFRLCTNLKNIVLPSSLLYINESAFYSCKSLKTLTLPQSLQNIGPTVFYGCTNLIIDTSHNPNFNITHDMLFSEQKEHLTEYFSSDPNNEIHIPSTCKYINKGVFNKKQFKSITFDGNTLISILNYAFLSSTIKTIILPESLQSLGSECFMDCVNLTSVVFNGNNINTIPDKCFMNCVQLTDINIPHSIEVIGQYAFYGCNNIGDIGISSSNIKNIGMYCFSNSGLRTFINYHMVEDLDYTYNIFEGCHSLDEVKLNASIVPKYCFYNCSSLSKLTLLEGVSSIEDFALLYCKSLSTIIIPDSLTTINNFAFFYCNSLSSFLLGAHSLLNIVYGGAFIGCENLVTINASLSPFHRFSNGALTDFNETNLITFLPSSKATTFVVPQTMISIGNYAFMSCNNLIRVIFSGNKLEQIGYQSFKDCKKLSFVFVMSSNLESIGVEAFIGCPLLTRCGSIFCLPQKFQYFIDRGIPAISLKDECSDSQLSCIPNKYSISDFANTLIYIFILI